MPDPALSAAGLLPFVFERDSFAFANELVWEYRFDTADRRPVTTRRQPPPTYAHRCFVLARTARQFWLHAAFEPSLAALSEAEYRRRIRVVAARRPWKACPPEQRVVFPGADGLRTFSRQWELSLKAACGGAWRSYALRSHWRMVLPISRRHQERTASRLAANLQRQGTAIVHLVRFPQLTINHGLLLFGDEPCAAGTRFAAYDPNYPERPGTLLYDHHERTFSMPANRYWPGGRVDVIEIYRSWFF